MTKQSKSKKKGKSYKDQSEMPKRASLNTRIANKLTKKKADSTLGSYRSGFRSMWQVARQKLKKLKIKEPGTYDPKNPHKGEMWGWPFEMNLTNNKVTQIMYAVRENSNMCEDQWVMRGNSTQRRRKTRRTRRTGLACVAVGR